MNPFKKQSGLARAIIILIVILIVAGAIGYYFYKEKKAKESIDETADLSSTPEEQIISTKDKIFFTERGNIFMMDEFGKRTQITKYAKSYPEKEQLQIIDDEHLGYYECDALVGDYNCGVYRVNVSAEQIEKLVREEKDKLITHLTWYDKGTFVYTVRVDFLEQELLYLYDNGSKGKIGEIKGRIKAVGRQLAFSPNGTKTLLEAVTFSPRVLDFYGNELVKIKNATELDWIDEKTIIFRRPGEGLYSFDILSQKEKKYETDEKAHNPKVLRDSQKVVYFTHSWVHGDKGQVVHKDNGQVWLMDLTTGKSEKLLGNASHPLWISQERILVSKNHKCPEQEPWVFPCTTSISIFNISTKEAFDIEEIDKGWHYFTTSLSKEGYGYYLK